MDSFVPRQGEFSVLDSRPWFPDAYFRGVQWATSTGWQMTEGGFSYPPNLDLDHDRDLDLDRNRPRIQNPGID